jgi:hypothetical protein
MPFVPDGAPLSDYARYMVTILVHEENPPGRMNQWNGSGFVVEVRGRWRLVTAGHVIKALGEQHSSGRQMAIFLCDAWRDAGTGRGRPMVLPVDPARWSIFGDADTLDYGVIELGPLLTANLQAGKVLPVAEAEWQDASHQFDHYMLLGTPNELVTQLDSDNKPPWMYDIARCVINATKVPKPPHVAATAHERFFGKLSENKGGDKVLRDIGGCSGGPVLGVQKVPGGENISFVAVQSGWFPSSKIIVADYLTTLVAMLPA